MSDRIYGLIPLSLGVACFALGYRATRKYSQEANRDAIGSFMRFTKGGIYYMAGVFAIIVGLILLLVMTPLFFL